MGEGSMKTYWDEIKEIADDLEEAWKDEDWLRVFKIGAKLSALAYNFMAEAWQKK